jgi:hypothetical protein
MGDNEEGREAALYRALRLITEALDIADGFEGPPDAAALLELARQKIADNLHTGEKRRRSENA